MGIIRLCYASDLPTPDEAIRLLKKELEGATVSEPTQVPTGDDPPRHADALMVRTEQAIVASSAASEANPKSNGPVLKSLQDVARLAGRMKDARLRTEIESYVHVESFEPQRLTICLADNAPGDLANRLMRSLKTWTGEHWAVTVASREPSTPTLREARQAMVENHPAVKQVLDTFPGARIHRIIETDADADEELLDPEGDARNDQDAGTHDNFKEREVRGS